MRKFGRLMLGMVFLAPTALLAAPPDPSPFIPLLEDFLAFLTDLVEIIAAIIEALTNF